MTLLLAYEFSEKHQKRTRIYAGNFYAEREEAQGKLLSDQKSRRSLETSTGF